MSCTAAPIVAEVAAGLIAVVYFPTAVVSDVPAFADVAEPLAIGTAEPTCVPPDTQPPAVTWDGLQRKKEMVPVGSGRLATPEMVATSCWFATPIGFDEPPGVAVVPMSGGTQVSKLPPAKSFSVAVICGEERVSARKVVKQPPCAPSRVVRAIPASTQVLLA